LNDVWVSLIIAKNEIDGLFGADWFMSAVKSAFAPSQKLRDAITPLTDRTDFDAVLIHLEVYNVINAVQEFETVLRNELAIADAYFVIRKGGYDTSVLIANAERCFLFELVNKVLNAVFDIREAGKCLVFELNTVVGFHVLRAIETVVRSYWDNVSKGSAHPRPKIMGRYFAEMEKKDYGSKKVRAAIKQITDLHRNPLIHPEEKLNLDEAVSFFGIC